MIAHQSCTFVRNFSTVEMLLSVFLWEISPLRKTPRGSFLGFFLFFPLHYSYRETEVESLRFSFIDSSWTPKVSLRSSLLFLDLLVVPQEIWAGSSGERSSAASDLEGISNPQDCWINFIWVSENDHQTCSRHVLSFFCPPDKLWQTDGRIQYNTMDFTLLLLRNISVAAPYYMYPVDIVISSSLQYFPEGAGELWAATRGCWSLLCHLGESWFQPFDLCCVGHDAMLLTDSPLLFSRLTSSTFMWITARTNQTPVSSYWSMLAPSLTWVKPQVFPHRSSPIVSLHNRH